MQAKLVIEDAPLPASVGAAEAEQVIRRFVRDEAGVIVTLVQTAMIHVPAYPGDNTCVPGGSTVEALVMLS